MVGILLRSSSQMPATQRHSLSAILSEDSEQGSDTALFCLRSDFRLSDFAWLLELGYGGYIYTIK